MPRPRRKKSKNSDILLWLPARNNPGKLDKTLSMLYSTCSSPSNFDIQVIIDSDQIELYQQVKNKYVDNNIIWSHPDHIKNDFWNMIQAEFDFLENNDYYFAWLITDDFSGLSHGWDKEIIKKREYFKDNLFTMHTVGYGYHRRQDVFQAQYVYTNLRNLKSNKAIGIPEGNIIWHYSECLPLSTKRWWMMMRSLFKPNYLTAQSEHLTAALAMILSTEYNHNRLIPGGFSWERLEDNGATAHIGVGDCGSRIALFTKWTEEEDFSIIRNIAKNINDIIILEQSWENE